MFKFLGVVGVLATICTATLLNEEKVKENVQLIYATDADAVESYLDESTSGVLDPAKTTVFLVHGWIEDESTNYYPAIFNEYMKKGGYNVIRVNWEKYAKAGYLTSKLLVERVGIRIGNFIDYIHKHHHIDLKKVHIVGHSLGSHVAGFAGQTIKNLSGPIGRISGLDPAGPGFDYFTSDTRKLTPTDAIMVDCLYTNRGIFGTTEILGTHNFYANGATFQPGCPFDNDDKTGTFFCSHQRSTSLFSESINSKKFIAVKIDDFGIFGASGFDESVKVIYGENTNATAGMYQFDTKGNMPYALD